MSVSGATGNTPKQNTRTTRSTRTREIVEEITEDTGTTGTTKEGKGPARQDEVLSLKEQVPDKVSKEPDEASDRSLVQSKHGASSTGR